MPGGPGEELRAAYRVEVAAVRAVREKAIREASKRIANARKGSALTRRTEAGLVLEAVVDACDGAIARLITAHFRSGDHDEVAISAEIRERFIKSAMSDAPAFCLLHGTGSDGAFLVRVAAQHRAAFGARRAQLEGAIRDRALVARSIAGHQATAPAADRAPVEALRGEPSRLEPNDSRTEPVDVLILTVIPAELQAMLAAFAVAKSAREKAPDGTVYHRMSVRSERSGRELSVTVMCIGDAGNPEAAAATSFAIARYSPRVVFLSGIAGGMRGKVKIGEVVLPNRILAYEPAALVVSEDGTEDSEPRPDIDRVPYRIQQDVANYSPSSERLRERFRKAGGAFPSADPNREAEYAKHVAAEISVRIGSTIGSGEKLFRDPGRLHSLRKLHGKTEAAEMEASGFVTACRRAGLPWLVVRGISDFGDEFKDDAFHRFAALAAATVLADFVDQGLELEPETGTPAGDGSHPASSKIDLEDHLKSMRAWAHTPTAHPRVAYAADNSPVTVSATVKDATLDVEDGASYFVEGWSGRGKTTVLQMLARRAMEDEPPRIPVVLPYNSPSTTLLSRVCEALKLTMSGVTDVAVGQWLQRTPTLLLVDDWHRLDEPCRREIETAAVQLGGMPSALVIAGAESVAPPRVPRLHHVRLRAYTVVERDRLIDEHVGEAFGRRQHILDNLPLGLAELLCEPIFLAKFLEAVEISRGGGLHFPSNVHALMGDLFASRLRSHDETPGRVDEFATVCRQVAASEPVRFEKIADVVRVSGLTSAPAEIANALCTAGIWSHLGGGLYRFEHDIWRTYFKHVAQMAADLWGTPATIASWVRSVDEAELRLAIPFVSGALEKLELQDAFYSALLARSFELYLCALTTRSDSKQVGNERERARLCLEQLHRGYFNVVDTQFAGLKKQLEPWSHGDGAEIQRGEEPVTVGIVEDRILSYYFGFAPKSGSDVILRLSDSVFAERPQFAPTNGLTQHSLDLTLSRRRRDSGRLVSAEQVLAQVDRLLSDDKLPAVGWVARERFSDSVRRMAVEGFGPKGHWLEWSVDAFRKWLEKQKVIATKQHGQSAQVEFSVSGPPVALDELLELADVLTRDGLARSRIRELSLPGPDLEESGSIAAAYSKEARQGRVRALYDAVVKTYRTMCETCFAGASAHFFFAQFPCRAVVKVEAESNEPFAGWKMWWEVVENWGEMPIVDLVGKREAWPPLDELASQARAQCARFGRPFIEFSGTETTGYSAWEPLVTTTVSDMLRDDVKRLKRWLANAT